MLGVKRGTPWWTLATAIVLVCGCSDSAPPGAGGGVGADADVEPADMAADAEVDAVVAADPCTPCAVDDDCPSGRCLTIGEVGVCLLECDDVGGCPEGYGCADGERPLCLPRPGTCLGCDDPGAAVDLCDGFDNDCDGVVDEDFVGEPCGVGACAAVSACEEGVIVECADRLGAAAPDDDGCDGVDDDCDGVVDEDYVGTPCGAGPCVAESACVDGIETACTPNAGAAAATDDGCDGVDDDCDGSVDEGYVPAQCGVGACVAGAVCEDGAEVCAPAAPAAADAACDGLDEDCDGVVDEDFGDGDGCGVGECHAATVCVGGAPACTPGEPFMVGVDQTCDGLDEDCDGLVDEDCVDNEVGFNWVSDSEDFVDLDVVFSQLEGADSASARFFMPRLIELVVVLPDSLSPLPSMTDTVEPGPATLAAEKLLNAVAEDGNRIRITIMSVRNSERIAPGVLAHLHLRRLPGVDPPFRLEFDERLSAFAPEESHDRLTLDGGDVAP